MPSIRLVPRLASENDIARLATRTLRQAGVVGSLPTPLDQLIAAAQVQEVAEPETWRDRFLASLPAVSRALFEIAWQKIRGIADLRDRVVYVPGAAGGRPTQFPLAHELGHQVIPWHKINLAYRDDDLSLSPEAEEVLDAEANFFAAEVIFQGKGFRRAALEFQPSFDAVFKLADMYGASRHATLRRYVEEHDEPIAMFPYWPSTYAVDHEGCPILRLGKGVGSARFLEKYGDVEPPEKLRSGDPWAAAREVSSTCRGEIKLACGGDHISFDWNAWWNSYSLLVLLRKRPALAFLGRSVS
jgi:hypothetical protein